MNTIDKNKKHLNNEQHPALWQKTIPIVAKLIQLLILSSTLVFILSPRLLNYEWFDTKMHEFFSALNTSDYVSSYIESIGALLGTFLAITGTIWTQRIIDAQNSKQQLKESAIIIYYDFRFAVDDIQELMSSYLDPSQENKTTLRIYIDDKWIRTVAKLSPVFDSDEIKAIYALYGHLSTIKAALDNSSVKTDSIDQTAYSLMYHEICNVTEPSDNSPHMSVSIRKDIETLIDKLYQESGLSEKKKNQLLTFLTHLVSSK